MGPKIVAFFCGLVFAIGLAVAGMTDPNKVRAFLDVTGDWDPSLAFVMGGAIAVYATVYHLIHRRGPVLETGEVKTELDGRLLLGATLFGLGWGLVGYCPGPTIVSLASLSSSVLVVGGSMIAGMFAFRLWSRRPSKAS
jgi:uncharacterized membrane protein YedE/YeeE